VPVEPPPPPPPVEVRVVMPVPDNTELEPLGATPEVVPPEPPAPTVTV